MPFDDLLYFREGAVDGDTTTNNISTGFLKISETPVAGLGINLVVPEVASAGLDKLTVDIYESTAGSWATSKLCKRFNGFPSTFVAGSFWDRFYTDEDYVACYVTIVSVATSSAACDFGAVDIRLTDRFAKYAGQ